MPGWEEAIDRYIESIGGHVQTARRHLHMHPEPSGEEFETTRYLADQLLSAGIGHRIIPSGRGIITDSAENSPCCVAIRADMDALKIQDQKTTLYRSRRDGVMHACGHDAHSAMVLGAALALQNVKDQLPWPCHWRAIFQPSEETSQGAREMIAANALENVQSIVALHVDPDRPAGRVGIRNGELTACCHEISAVITGRGGHAARPHESIDPIAAAVHFIGDVYRIIPRRVDSRDAVVVTFGMIQGGECSNVIPDSVQLKGTLRTLSRQAADKALETMECIRQGVANISGANIELNADYVLNGVYNNPAVMETMREASLRVLGQDGVEYIPQPSLGGEDFAEYLSHVPGSLLRLGAAREGERHFLHSPMFDIDERALIIGAKILARTLVLLSRPSEESQS